MVEVQSRRETVLQAVVLRAYRSRLTELLEPDISLLRQAKELTEVKFKNPKEAKRTLVAIPYLHSQNCKNIRLPTNSSIFEKMGRVEETVQIYEKKRPIVLQEDGLRKQRKGVLN